MYIIFNGEKIFLQSPMNLRQLINQKGYRNTPIAIALNCEFIPKIYYAKTILREGDCVEIVTPMQGG